MENLSKNQKIILIVILIFMIIFIFYYILKKTDNSEYVELDVEENVYENSNNEIEDNYAQVEEKIIVHVIGSVKIKGIVELERGARISDVIEAAGGTTEDADLSKINLAYVVEDGQKIYVPNKSDSESINNVTEDAGYNVIEQNNTSSNFKKVNINTASQTELETLNGIGPSTALKIINYRNENGIFEKIEDLKNVPGIGESKYENLKDSICVK